MMLFLTFIILIIFCQIILDCASRNFSVLNDQFWLLMELATELDVAGGRAVVAQLFR